MKYQFEEFTEVGTRAVNEPRVTITKHGIFNLNKAFMKTFVKDQTHVIFHYDKENRVIGLKLTNQPAPNSYKIRIARKGTLASVSAQAFLKYNRLRRKKSYPYSAIWDEESRLIIIDLKKDKD